jgi:hypothetical protein
MFNQTIVQRRWRDGVLTLDCRGYGTPSFGGIHLSSWYGKASLSRQKLKITRMPTLSLIQMISKTLNLSYYQSCVRVRALGRHSPILMFNFRNVRIIACPCICNSWRDRLLFERPGRVSTRKRGAVKTELDFKPWQYSVMRSHETHSILGFPAIRFKSDRTQHCYSLLQQRLKVYIHRMKGV